MVLVLGIVKASLEILGIGIGVKKVVLLRSALWVARLVDTNIFGVSNKNDRGTFANPTYPKCPWGPNSAQNIDT